MWYFSSPFIVFGEDALSYLRQIQGNRAFIVTDATLHRLGFTTRIEQLLHEAGLETTIFNEVEPEPSLETVKRGALLASGFQPDWFIGLGGGSPLDAAKAIWALYERPDLSPTDINPIDILGLHKAKLIAIPTTSGTGSEATWALVLTDTAERRKFGTGSRELVPTFAIVDPSLTSQLPQSITADTGLDALTHAIEGFVSTWRNDFSDGLCLKAAKLILEYLPRAVAAGGDVEAREKMAIAATLAGLGFGNSNLGLAHAMGHSLGALFKIPHGRSVALFLPFIIEYTCNGGAGRYAEISRFVGLTDSHDEEIGGRLLVQAVRNLQVELGQPMSIAAMGISETDFRAALPTLCLHAEQDTQFFTAPRLPDSEELAQLFECVNIGEAITF